MVAGTVRIRIRKERKTEAILGSVWTGPEG
jgi:hypothetical protein